MYTRTRTTILMGVLALATVTAVAQTEAGAASAMQTQSAARALGSSQGALQSQSRAATAAHAGAAVPDLASSRSAFKSGTRINAILKSKLDARKAHVGQPVVAESTEAIKSHGKVVLPKHSRLLGHVTSVSARGKGNSSLGVLFDQAVTPRGQRIPLTAGISSVLTAAGSASTMDSGAMDSPSMPMPMAAPMPAASAGGGLLGGVTSSLGSAVGGVTSMASGSVAGNGMLRGGGLPLQIQPIAVPAGAQGGGSLLTSDRGFVHLDRGTHLQLQTQSQSQSQSSVQAQPAGTSASASASASSSAQLRRP